VTMFIVYLPCHHTVPIVASCWKKAQQNLTLPYGNSYNG
jgi:hypothetical protein